MKLSHKFQWGKLWTGFSLSIWCNFRKTAEVTGITDACPATLPFRRVLFLEYDVKLNDQYLRAELQHIQQKFRLSNIYILESSKDSYHAYCCDKLSSFEVNKIIKETSCDDAFRNNWRYDFACRVLRISEKGSKPKPKYVCCIKSNHNQRQKSYPHLIFIKNYFQIPETDMDFTNNDGELIGNKDNAIETIQYPTSHNVT